MTLLITTAAVLVIATIVVSLSTASDLQKQRQRISELEQAALRAEQELEQVEDQKRTVLGSLGLHTNLRDERLSKIEELNEELEFLQEDRAPDRDIKVAGTREGSFSFDDPENSDLN